MVRSDAQRTSPVRSRQRHPARETVNMPSNPRRPVSALTGHLPQSAAAVGRGVASATGTFPGCIWVRER